MAAGRAGWINIGCVNKETEDTVEELISFIESLKADQEIKGYDEASTKQTIVLRVLSLVGWNIFKHDEVFPEYSVGNQRVDYSLRLGGENKVFIEVKKVGEDLDNERHQKQLLEYSFNLGVRLAILTNGISWWLYLPLSEGSWEQRKFYSINIREQDSNDVVMRFDQFLNKDNVSVGAAYKNAEAVYKSQKRDKAIKEAIPKAWNKLLDEEDELLVELISETVEKICGYKAENELVSKFLRINKDHISVDTYVHPSSKVKPPSVYKRENTKIKRPEHITRTRNEFKREGDKAEIIVHSNTPMRWYLIPLSKTIRDLFPGYKVPFRMITDIGEIETKVTSSRSSVAHGDPFAGAYIQGGLNKWYKHHIGIKEGSTIIIKTITPQKVFRLDVKE